MTTKRPNIVVIMSDDVGIWNSSRSANVEAIGTTETD